MGSDNKSSLEQHQIRVRQLRLDDFDDLVEMQKLCFPGMETWDREHIESQLEIFPEGQMVVEYDGRLVASAGSVIVDESDFDDWHNWKSIADDGFIRTHDEEGDTLYGIEIMVHPEFRGMKLSRRLYEARKELVRKRNLRRIIIGGRIPGYGEHAEEMSAHEYLEALVQKKLFDPVLTPQLANGFVLKGLIPQYLPTDTESRGYATHLEWINLEWVPQQEMRTSRSVTHVRVCVLQYQLRNLSSFEHFVQQAEFFVDVASDYRSDFVLFPELFTLPLMGLSGEQERPATAARALAEYTPQVVETFNQLAIRYHVNIVAGSTYTVENDRLYNVSHLFRRDGTIGKQYKLHITPAERKWFGVAAGERLEVFDTDRGKIALLVCYDVEFPELSRIAAQRGARLLFVPYNTDERNGYLRVRYCSQARAIENHCYVIISGCVGNLPLVENADVHYAQSAIFTPADFSFARDGIAGETSQNIEQVLVTDLDLELLRHHRLTGTVQNWHDRRQDMYRIRVKNGDEEFEF